MLKIELRNMPEMGTINEFTIQTEFEENNKMSLKKSQNQKS